MYGKLNVIIRKINNWNIFSGTKCVSRLMDGSLPHLTSKVWLSLIAAKGQEHVSWQLQCNNKVSLLFPRSTCKSSSCAIVYCMQSKFKKYQHIFTHKKFYTRLILFFIIIHFLFYFINIKILFYITIFPKKWIVK